MMKQIMVTQNGIGPTLVKDTIGNRDSSATMLDVIAANGAIFSDIMHKLWEQFRSCVKGLALKQDGVWSIETPTEAAWYKTMQLKWNVHLVPPTTSETAWNRWLAKHLGDTVTLMIYEYGLGIPNARSLKKFMDARICPQHTDRSRAAAKTSIREVIARLQDIWGQTYQGNAIIWRMWANEIMRNLDRSTWEVNVLDRPPAAVEHLLRAADGEAELHLANLSRST
ncbi:hypothetical protein PHMEG_00034669 [Phytophthora megakarya]|uniref:Uncharacterized protein n=1 Tax=Phytophthora megakarya TaxID=4795 RepID=A0A225UQW3_9STRA|nr:hypothetical protein PHMEG_00034669 [Phytophthora megakarya]